MIRSQGFLLGGTIVVRKEGNCLREIKEKTFFKGDTAAHFEIGRSKGN